MNLPLPLRISFMVVSSLDGVLPKLSDVVTGRFASGAGAKFNDEISDKLIVAACAKLPGIPLHQIQGAVEAIRRWCPCDLGRSAHNWEAHPAKGGILIPALGVLADTLFVYRRGMPALSNDFLLEFQYLSAHLYPDQILCFALALAEHEAGWGLARRRSDRELAELFADGLYPPVDDAIIEALRQEGLAEVHRHMNGSALPGVLWHRLVVERVSPSGYFSRAALVSGDSGQKYYGWILAAGHLRFAILAFLLRQDERGFLQRWSADIRSRFTWLGDIGLGRETPDVCRNSWLHRTLDPAEFLPGASDDAISRERALLMAAYRFLLEKPFPPPSEMAVFARNLFQLTLHAYLLIQNKVLRELLQPREDARGFDRFAEYSQSPVRRMLENGVVDRVRQAAHTGGVRWLELRLAPRESLGELRKQLGSFFSKPHGDAHDPFLIKQVSACNSPLQLPRVGVVFHFIREVDPLDDADKPGGPTWPARHAALRRKLWNQAHALAKLRFAVPSMGDGVVGLDVANAETATPPEVFAPVIRGLRRHPASLQGECRLLSISLGGNSSQNPWGLTCHAGEDFRHILSGLRTVDEALRFLDMGSGDRIGHGVALGLEPLPWIERYGGEFFLPCHEWLDDLVWFRQRLASVPDSAELALMVEGELTKLAQRIYGNDSEGKHDVTPNWVLLHEAWKLRARDPLGLDKGILAFTKQFESGDEVERLFHRYHFDPNVREQGRKPFTVTWDRRDWPKWARVIRHIQDDILRELKHLGIAIEANPTSNLTICPIDKMEDHPIFRWHPPGRDDSAIRPFVVVGSDDPGIFATELIYEYAYLARAAQERGGEQREIRDWLRELRQTSIDFCFVKRG